MVWIYVRRENIDKALHARLDSISTGGFKGIRIHTCGPGFPLLSGRAVGFDFELMVFSFLFVLSLAFALALAGFH